jgi:cbb3-type cytochrome oxidase subunit 3
LKKSEAVSAPEKSSPPRPVYLLSLAALFLGFIAFLLRAGEVGILVSLADSLFLSAIVLLSLASLIFVYRKGGFDIFIYSLGRLRWWGGGAEDKGYFEFSHRPRSQDKLISPLLIFGGALFLLSLIVTLL